MSLLGRLHATFVFDRRTRMLAETLDRLLPERATVVDVGCGDGMLAKKLAERRVDLSIRGLDVLERSSTHIPVTVFDGTTIPLEGGEADFAVLVDVLHHVDEPERLLRECGRVASRGVIVKDHLCENLLDRETLKLMDRVGNRPHGVATPFNYLSRAEWRDLIGRCELMVDEWSEDLGLYPVPFDWIFGRRLHVATRLRPL